MGIRHFFGPCLAAALLAGCVHEPPVDKEQVAFYDEVTNGILLGDGGKAKPNRVVYVANPRIPPFRTLYLGVRYSSVDAELFKEYGKRILLKGWTILCVRDNEKKKLFIFLVQDGKFLSYRLEPFDSPKDMACRAKGGAA